ncbi:unnamed protein product [Cochlearia groenlandica]
MAVISVSKRCMSMIRLVMIILLTRTSDLYATSHNIMVEEETSTSRYYACHSNLQKCHTFAILRAISKSNHHVHSNLLFIPIDCICNDGNFYEAYLFKTCVKGDTFRSVSASMQGLTTCLSIREKNPQVSEDILDENVTLRLTVSCSCPDEGVSNARFLVTYPVSEGESVSSLAVKFNTTEDAIVSANNKSGVVPLRPALIPLLHKPVTKKKNRSKMKLMIALSSVIATVISLITLLVFGYLYCKKASTQTLNWINNNKDPETRQLSLSIRTTSDKKISFEGSHEGSILDSHNTVGTTTPRKPVVEIYAFEELEKATENFSASNHIKEQVGDQEPVHRVLLLLPGMETEDIQNKLAIKNQYIESCYCFLAWKQRIKICHDVSIALKYMHRINYVHGNIKSRNIFLNEDLRGKLGGFGMSRAREEKIIDGGCSVSAATDVFAYGVVVMEVLSGRTPEMLIGTQEEEEDWERLRRVLGDKETLKEVMDSTLGESYSVDSALEIASIAIDCTAEEPMSRPSAAEIAERVSRLVEDDNDELALTN